MFTTTTATNILKNRYLGPIREELENSSVLFSEIKKETRIKVSGKNWTVPLHTRRNLSAAMGRAENVALQTASEQGYANAIVPAAYQYGRIEISGPAFAATRDDAGAFIRALSSEVEGLSRDMIKGFNRQFHSDGVDALAYAVGADDATPANVDDGQGNPFTFLRVGDTIDWLDASASYAVLGTGSVITSLTPAATNVAVAWSTASPTGTAAGDPLVLTGTSGQQLMGIRGIVSNANPPLLTSGLHGIPVSGNAYWTAQVNSNSGTLRPLSHLLMRKPLSAIAQNSDFKDSDVKFLLGSYEMQDEYYNLLVDSKRHPVTLELDGGFTGLDFCGIPFIADPDCRKNVIYYIVPESMRIFEAAPLDWLDKDGNVLHRREDKDAYTGTMFTYMNLGTTARNANALLADLQVSTS
jgi:hypothetical protein